MALPKIGLQAVLENSAGFTKSLDAVNKKTAETTAKMKEAAKNSPAMSSGLDKISGSVDSLKNKLAQMTGVNSQAAGGILELTGAIGPLAIAMGAAVIGAVALGGAILALGARGAPLVGLGESFDRLTASVGLSSQALLVDLRKAANGTVSDFDLIKRANLALVGSTGEFGKQFGQKLPQVLAAARAAAKATGQDVDFLFQSLVAGIKRASPRLIDNTGIVLRLGAANEALAKQLGKTVEQLTDEEKQIAVLNATVAAGNDLITQLNSSPELLASFEKQRAEIEKRKNAALDSLDQLRIGGEITAAQFASKQAEITGQFAQQQDALVQKQGQAMEAYALAHETAAEKIAKAQTSLTNILDGLSVAIQPAFTAILDVVNNVLGGIENGVRKIAPFINFIAQMIGNLVKGIGNILFGEGGIGQKLGEGAYNAFKSFAAGISFAANKLIFPAIIFIAKGIADLLIGLSPPPKGPLSVIDKGGENLMKAWLDGIVGVSLDPVEKVAAEVSLALGEVGKATLPAVNKRLAELDQALLPFQQRLDIVKSQFDAIAEPAKAALDAIDRQMQAAQEALANGDVNAANTIRQLDAARAAIQGQLDAQQAVVDQQQIQLGLATASQAQERALLNIRKAILTATQKTTAAAGGAAAGKIAAEKKPAAGAAPTPEEAASGGGALGIPTSSVLDQFGAASIDPQQVLDFATQFAGEQNLADFQANSDALQTQLGRIGSVDLGSKLKDKFKGLTDIFDPSVDGSVANKVQNFFSSDPNVAGSFASFVASLSNIDLSAVGFSIGESLGNALVFLTGDGEETLKGKLAVLTGDANVQGSVANFFAQIPTKIADALSGIYDQVVGAFSGVYDFFTGTEGLTLSSILQTAVQFFSDLPGQIVTALQGFGASLYASFAVPIITVINSVIELVESGVKGFIKGVADFVGGITDGLDSLNLGINTAPLHNLVADLNTKSGKVSFGRVSTALPALLTPQVPGAATGGMFGSGLLRVGERGPELIGAADKIGVLPAGLTRALEGLGSILAQPAPMNVPSGDTFNQSSSSFTFNGVQSDNDARRRYNALRAGMR